MIKNILAIGMMLVFVSVISMIWSWLPGLLTIAALVLLLNLPTAPAATGGFISAFLVWGGYAFYLSSANAHLMANQIGDLFGGLSPYILILGTGLVGGLAGALIGWSVSIITKPDKRGGLV